MAESTSVALAAATIPSSADIARAEKFVRERFLHEGEDPAVALAPGTPRRRALDQALAELKADPKAKHPSTAWRREFSLLLGLERLLSEEEPKLADGTVALGAPGRRAVGHADRAARRGAAHRANGNGRASASASPELLASADILGPEDASANGAQRGAGRARTHADADEEAPDEDEDDDERGRRRGGRRRARAGAARGARGGRGRRRARRGRGG